MATRGSSKWQNETWGDPCPRARTTIPFNGHRITVNEKAVEAFTALATVIDAHKYPVRSKDTGAYNCRHMRNDPKAPMSNHSWGTAVDINWQSNPAGKKFVSDMPREMVEDIHRIKTKSGHRVFRWGGDWDNDWKTQHSYYDAMHYELYVTPQELATGIDYSTVRGTAAEVRIMNKLVYTKRGTPDGDAAGSAEGLAPQKGLVTTTDLTTAKSALSEGLTVIAVGGPAFRQLGGKATAPGIHKEANLTGVQGATGIRTGILIHEFAEKGW